MKNRFYCFLSVLILVLSNTSFSYSPYWTSLNSGVTNTLRKIDFVNDSIGWTVGDVGRILKTTNGGQTWVDQTSGTTRNLYGVDFYNSSVGYAVGSYLTILKTTNGGDEWRTLNTNATISNAILGVSALRADTAMVVGERYGGSPYVNALLTTNGGTNWTSLYLISATILNSVINYNSQNFNDPYYFLVCGTNGKVATYSLRNGTVSDISSGTNTYYDVYDTYSSYPTPLGSHTKVVSSTSGVIKKKYQSNAWTTESAGSQTLYGINGYWAVGSSGVLWSQLGTSTWTQYSSSPTPNTLYAITHQNSNATYACGVSGTIIKYIENTIYPQNVNASYCQDESFTITYSEGGYYYSGNTFQAQLSSSTGSFASPTTIGTRTSQFGGAISCRIPKTASVGSGYRIRIISTSPTVIGDSTTAVFSIKGLPTPSITGTSNVCAKSISSYAASAITGSNKWYVTGGTINGLDTNSSVSITWGTGTSGIVKLIQTSSYGCKDSTTKNISISPLPNPSITGTSNVCAKSISSYAASAITGSNKWVVTGGTINGLDTNSSVSITWGTGTSGIVKLIQTSSFGCKDSISKNITIDPLPTPSFDGDTIVCEKNVFRYNAQVYKSNFYKWNVSGGSIIGADNGKSVDILWGLSGLGKLKLVQNDGLTMCIDSIEKDITINQLPIPEISGDTNVCAKNQSKFISNTNSGSNQWEVDGGTIIGSNNSVSVDILWGSATSGAIKLIQTTTSGCKDSIEKTITINPLPQPGFIGDSIVCSGITTIYNINSPLGSFIWSATEGTIIGSRYNSTVKINWGTSSTGQVKVVQTSSLGCIDSITKNININPQPKPVINGPISVCQNSKNQYKSNNIQGTYLWKVNGGTINSSLNTNIVDITWTNQNFGDLTLIQTNEFGCMDSIVMDITINKIPTPKISGNTKVEELSVQQYSSLKPNGTDNQWYVVGGTPSGPSNQQNFDVKWGSYGVGKIILEQTNQTSGCQANDTIIIKMDPVGTFSANAGSDKSICEGDSTEIGTVSPASGGKPPYKYRWEPSIGLSQDTLPNPICSIKKTTLYKLTITDSRDIKTTDDVEVKIDPLPIPSIAGKSSSSVGDRLTYTAYTPLGTDNQWSVNGGSIIGSRIGQSVEIEWGTPMLGNVILEQTTSAGCKDQVSYNVLITAPGPFMVTLDQAVEVCQGSSVELGKSLVVSGGKPPYKYKWSPSIGLTSDTIANPDAIVAKTTKFSLAVTDSKDSVKTVTIEVIINPLPTTKITETGSQYKVGNNSVFKATTPSKIKNEWSVKGGEINGPDNLDSVKVLWKQSGKNRVYLKQTIEIVNCENSDSLEVNVTAPDNLTVFAGADKEVCEQQATQIGSLNPASGGKAPYKLKWSPSTGLSNDTLPNPDAMPLSTTTYTIKVTDALGDTANSKVIITVNPVPKPKITGKNIVLLNSQESYSVLSVAGSTYKWIVENGSVVDKDTDPSINITWNQNKTGKLKITQTTDKSCFAEDSISVSVNAAGDCISTTDLNLPECYIIPGYEAVKLGTVKFKNICEENSRITKLEFQSASGQFTIKDTMPDVLTILKPMNEAQFVVAFKPQKAGADEAYITIETDKGERKTSKITSFGVQGNDKTPLTVLKIIPSPSKDKPGTMVNIEIRIVEAKNVDIKGSMAFIASMSWNSQVLQYLNFNKLEGRVHLNNTVPPMFDINSYDFSVELEGNARSGNTQLAEIYTKAMLGEYSQTELIFRDFKWLDTTIKAEILNDGIFELDLCKEDGLRMLKLSNQAQITAISPNPVKESASIKYSLLEDGQTSLMIINALGIQKKVLFNEEKKSGNYELLFSTEDLTTGVYYILMQTPSGIYRKRMVVIK